MSRDSILEKQSLRPSIKKHEGFITYVRKYQNLNSFTNQEFNAFQDNTALSTSKKKLITPAPVENVKTPAQIRRSFTFKIRNGRTNIYIALQNIQTNIIASWESFKKRHLIISPDSFGKLLWDVICLLIIFYDLMSIPFRISFNVTFSPEFDTFITIAFFFDMIITTNTAFYQDGELIYKRKLIVLEYIKLWFWLDLAATFPYDSFIEATVENSGQSGQLLAMLKIIRFVKILRLLRLAKLKVIFDKLEELLQLSSSLAGIFSFIKLCIFTLFWSHWIGCFFLYIALQEPVAVNYNLQDEDWFIAYEAALYWAVQTMTTIGYGDVSPQTKIERLIGVVFLLIASFVFAYTMNSIGAALQQINEKKEEFRFK